MGEVVDEVDMVGENDNSILGASPVPTPSGSSAPVVSNVVESQPPTPTGNMDDDRTHDNRYLMSASAAFPYDYIDGNEEGNENDSQISHIRIVKFIKEKRAQRRVRFSIAISAAQRVKDSVPEEGDLDTDQVEEAVWVLNDAHEDMKDYTRQVLEKIDSLFQLVHASLRKDREAE